MDDHSSDRTTPVGPGERQGLRLTAKSRATRIPPRRSRGSHCGTLVAFEQPRELLYESKLEADAMALIQVRRDLVDLREQVEPFHYIDADGRDRSTRFDLMVTLSDGRRIATAVKPQAIAERSGLAARLQQIAARMPRSFATAVMLLTERQVRPTAVRNARLILSVRHDPPSTDAAALVAASSNLAGSVTIASLIEVSGLEGRGFRAAIRCIDQGALLAVGDGPIVPATHVVRPNRNLGEVAA